MSARQGSFEWERPTGDPVSNLMTRHEISNGNDLTGALVSHDDRLGDRPTTHSAR
jgi:hypothetical protein